MDPLSVSSKNVPKLSLTTMNVKDNYYVIKSGQVYSYFPIKVKPFTPTDPIIRFEKSPPVLLEGIAIVGKKPYRVTPPPQDLMRQVIRKSREVAIPKRDKVNGTAESTSNTAVCETVQHPVKQRTSGEAPVEVLEAADNAWEEQIGTLLDFISEKEGFEFEVADSA
jgi:hypothetical protein